MSIRLEVEDYCQHCPEFEADVDSATIYSCGDKIQSTIIRCVNQGKCKTIKEFLENEMRHDN